jgi:hypothetical protein
MIQREFTVSNKIRLVETAGQHGSWTAFDLETGARLGSSIRLVSDLVDLLERLPKDGKHE